MKTQKTKQFEKFNSAMGEFYRAWQDVENAVIKVQAAVEGVRETFSEVTPDLARDPMGWQVLEPLLYLEELAVEASRVVDKVKQNKDVPPQYKIRIKQGRKPT